MYVRPMVAAAALVLAGLFLGGNALGQTLYFSRDFTQVWSADVDGMNQTSLFTYPNDPTIRDIAFDALNSVLYLVTEGQGPAFSVNAIDRINLDGTGFTQIIDVSPQFALSVAFNPADNKIYWLEQGSQGRRIRRANAADGSAPETVLIDSDATFRKIRIDIAAQQIYWTDAFDPNTMAGSVRRAPVGTSVSQTTVWSPVGPLNQTVLEGFDFNFAAADLIWVQDNGAIERGNIDGSNTITSVRSGAGTNVNDLVVDRVGNRLFWTDISADEVRSSPIGAGAQSTVIMTDVGRGLAVDNPDLPVSLEIFTVE